MAVSMDLWGVQDTGFYRPTIEDIKNAYVSLAKTILGEDIDTGEYTVLGMMFRIWAAMDNKQLEIDEMTYYSIFPHTATGVSLDRICETALLKRGGAGYAVHIIKVYGTENYIIEAGTQFKNDSGVEFYSVIDAIINQIDDLGKYAEVKIQCKENGIIGNVNDINSTVEVNTNITNILYKEIDTYGTDAESDAELREKYKKAVQGMGTGNEAAIKSNVLRLSSVNDVIIINNTTTNDMEISDNLTVATGTYAVIVHSDSTSNEQEIAEAIFEKAPMGTRQSGTENVQITDEASVIHDVKFTYVSTKEINIDVKCDVDSTFMSDSVQAIQDNITSYINNLGIGEKIVYSKLYSYIYAVTGVDVVTSMTINGGTDDIIVNQIEIAKTGDISITVKAV